jgi:EmrB/QacA subfamily drug resistance transporter
MSSERTNKAGSIISKPGANANGKSAGPVKARSSTSKPGASANGTSAKPAKAGSPTSKTGASANGTSAKPVAGAAHEQREGAGSAPNKWSVVFTVVFGIFMSVLDSTAVNVALPKMQAVFGATLDQIQGVVTYYLLALAVTIPLSGYLADRFGIKRTYITALVIFTVGSIMCGLAWSSGVLIFFRILQGLGGGALMPLALAMIYRVFPPEERGLASAAIGIPILFAPALGPTLAGYIVQYSDWRLIFYINVPIGMVGFFMALTFLRERRSLNPGRFDVPGFVLSTLGLSSVLYAVSKVPTIEGGWTSTTVLSFLAIGTASLLAFVYVELVVDSPLLDLRLFKDWNFFSGTIISVILQISLFGTLFLLSLFLQEERGLNAFETGLWLMPEALVIIMILPIAGILVDRLGAKWLIMVGIAALALASYGLSHLDLDTTFWGLQSVLIIRSVAFAFTLQPSQQVILYNVSSEALPRASSLSRVTSQIAASFGTAIMATYLQNRTPVHFADLAEQATSNSPAATYVAQVMQGLQAQGFSAPAAHIAALQILAQHLQQEATVLAFDDTYLLAATIAALGVFAALLLRGRPKAASQSDNSKEAIEARKAAMAEALV